MILDQDIIIFWYFDTSRLKIKNSFYLFIQKIPMEMRRFRVQSVPSVFQNLMFKLFFKYLDDVLACWMNDLLIYSQTEEEYLRHIQLVFENFYEAGIRLKMSRCEFFKSEIEYIGHLVFWKWISPMKQKLKIIMDLLLATNISEVRHIKGLIGYYRNSFLSLVTQYDHWMSWQRKWFLSNGLRNARKV